VCVQVRARSPVARSGCLSRERQPVPQSQSRRSSFATVGATPSVAGSAHQS
jgi:hypothetical protein